MSSPIQTNGTAVNVFQDRYGASPGTQDAKTECEKWQHLCDELLAERVRLRAELEKARLDEFCKGFELNLTMEQVYATVDRETTLEQLIAEFAQEAEKEA